MKNGIDSRAFAEAIKAADPAARKRLWSNYRTWIAQGARQQGTFAPLLGALLILGPALMAVYLWPLQEAWRWAALIAPVPIGAWLLWRGAQRERAWREANPFRW